jgi:hypothetical protein
MTYRFHPRRGETVLVTRRLNRSGVPIYHAPGCENARLDLESGFTTARDLSSGGTADVDLRNAIALGDRPGMAMTYGQLGLLARVVGFPPSSVSASSRTGRKGIESDFRFWPVAEAHGRPPRRPVSREHLPQVGADDPRHLRQSDACRAIRPLSKEVPSRQSRSSAAVYDPKQN